MSEPKKVPQKDWYEILNQNLKYINKDFDKINYKSRRLMNILNFNNLKYMDGPNVENKNKPKNQINNSTDIDFYPLENKLLLKKLNLKNYKNNNYINSNPDSLFLKHILEKMDHTNKKRTSIIIKSKNKSNTQINYFNEKTINNPKYINHEFKEMKKKFGINLSKDDKKIIYKNNNNLMCKTFSKIKNKTIDSNNETYFPRIKFKDKKRKIKRYYNKSNIEKKIMIKNILDEEDKSVIKANSISKKIIRLNEKFNKEKKLIYGYNNKDYDDDDYIVINKKKIYQINVENEINKKFRENILKLKRIKDIEDKLLNEKNNIFNATKKDLVKLYTNKKKKRYYNYKCQNDELN